MSRPVLSVVVPVLDEEAVLPELLHRVRQALDAEGIDYEVVFVDDGSTDASRQILQSFAAEDDRVKAVFLSRNFGHQVAIGAGMDLARGQAVVLMDGDLQDPPETIRDFLARWREGHQVVYGVRRRRKEGALKRAAYSLYYRVLARLASISVPLDSGDFCLMDRRVVDAIKNLPERGRFVRGLRAWVGLRQIGVEYERDARRAGSSKYTFRKLTALAAEGIVGFSSKPLKLASQLGFGMALLALALTLFYLLGWLFNGSDWPRGFASLFIGLCFMFGIQFMLLGILGEYVGSIHTEVKRRPAYLIDELVGFGEEGPAGAGETDSP